MAVRFSVVLIARNEAQNLGRLHKSLTEFQHRGGEVVLLDTGSTDDTPTVARGLGFKVEEVGTRFIMDLPTNQVDSINKKFVVHGEEPIVAVGNKIFDYSSARNYAASLASNDVVSMPDCDEQYTNLDIDAIEAAITAGYEQMEFHFIFSHYPNGQPAIQFRQCKMYDRRKMHWQGLIHEVLVGEANRTYLPPEVLLLEHFQAPQSYRSRYMAGLALDCYMNPSNDRNSHYLGRELYWSGRYHSAIKELTRHIAMKGWQQERGESMVFIGDCWMALKKDNKGLDAWWQAFLIDGTRRAPLLRLAEYFQRKNEYQKVACFATAALEIPSNDCYCNVGAHYTYEPHERLYWALWYLGDKARSKEHWDKALAYDPTNPKFISDGQFYGIVVDNYKPPAKDIQGWMGPNELEWLYHQAKKADSILELGSWKGRSTHALLTGCKGTVTCVDTWKGSVDTRDWTNAMAKNEDPFVAFKTNVGNFPNLEICQMESGDAAAKFKAEGRKFDMVFIDAGHSYEEVKRDIELWRPLTKTLLSGHDYENTWEGVVRAVNENVKGVKTSGPIWYSYNVAMPELKGKYPESLIEFTDKIKSGTSFTFVKCGDGELACMNGEEGSNCDGQPYSLELSTALRNAYTTMNEHGAYMAMWEDRAKVDGKLLLHRTDSDNLNNIKDFYTAIRESTKHKVFIGPNKLIGVSGLLKSGFIETPASNSFASYSYLWDRLGRVLTKGGIYIFSIGLTSKVLIAKALESCPDITCIDAGSSFDPLFIGQTRTYQVQREQLQALYADLLGPRVPKKIFTIWLSDNKIPDVIRQCIDTHSIPDYKWDLITLENCPKGIPYLDAAIAAKKWAKAADYLRIYKLIEEGGIYLDADVELLPGKNFDSLLNYPMFVCKENTNGFIASCVMGAEPQAKVLKECLAQIDSKFKGDDDKIFEASMGLITEPLYYASDDGRVKVLPPEYFTPYDHQTGEINVTSNTIAFHHFMKTWTDDKKEMLPKVAILLPALGRYSSMDRCMRSISNLYYPKHRIDVIIDWDEGTVPQKVNRMYKNNQADAYVYAANDTEFEPYSLYHAVQASSRNGLVAFNTGPLYHDGGNICEHFLIRRDLADELGEIFSEKFHHVGCDNLLWAKANKKGQACRCEEAHVIHHHFTRGAPMDDIYEKGWAHREEDRATLALELDKLCA